MNGEAINVVGASGAIFEVIHESERDYWNQARERYLEQYRFDNISDLQDLDKVILGETLSFRWGSWLAREADYDGRSIEEVADKFKKQKNDLDRETRILKEGMGLNRAHRQDSEQQSVADYLENLLKKAKEFGVHRDTQIAKAQDLLHEIFTLVGLWKRGDEEERAHLRATPEEILNWIDTVARSEYEAIDDAFRKNQVLWIREVS
jgi:hypothetical protein